MQDAFAKFQLSALAVQPPVLLAVSIAEKPKTLPSTTKSAKASAAEPESLPPLEKLQPKAESRLSPAMTSPLQQASQRTDSFEMVENGIEDEDQPAAEVLQPEGDVLQPLNGTAEQPVSSETLQEGEEGDFDTSLLCTLISLTCILTATSLLRFFYSAHAEA